jgi:7-cyano-7-deazaguanine synthase
MRSQPSPCPDFPSSLPVMQPSPTSHSIGLLVSGGLDSGILLGHYVAEGRRVQPFYVRSGLYWETAERAALGRLLKRLACDRLAPLIEFEMPMADVYGNHWSVTGHSVPPADTPDEAVYLPGRNALLLMKPAVWCRLHEIEELALAPLGSNPFADAGPAFFESFRQALNTAIGGKLVITRPFAQLHKRDVMEMGRHLPLELTFSCIAPVGNEHCGRCNKCAERQAAFRLIDLPDPTQYANA